MKAMQRPQASLVLKAQQGIGKQGLVSANNSGQAPFFAVKAVLFMEVYSCLWNKSSVSMEALISALDGR